MPIQQFWSYIMARTS